MAARTPRSPGLRESAPIGQGCPPALPWRGRGLSTSRRGDSRSHSCRRRSTAPTHGRPTVMRPESGRPECRAGSSGLNRWRKSGQPGGQALLDTPLYLFPHGRAVDGRCLPAAAAQRAEWVRAGAGRARLRNGRCRCRDPGAESYCSADQYFRDRPVVPHGHVVLFRELEMEAVGNAWYPVRRSGGPIGFNADAVGLDPVWHCAHAARLQANPDRP